MCASDDDELNSEHVCVYAQEEEESVADELELEDDYGVDHYASDDGGGDSDGGEATFQFIVPLFCFMHLKIYLGEHVERHDDGDDDIRFLHYNA